MENTIEFKGPFNINHLDKDLEQKLNNPGIYIWGFMVDSNYNPINCKNIVSFSPEKMKFLPYYVGMATGKSNMTILDRLNQHKNVKVGNARKYLRINKPFLKSFFNDKCFPIHYQKDNNFYKKLLSYNISKENKAISYFNNPMFMFFLYQKKLKTKLNELFNLHKSNQLPITLDIFKDCNIIDPLNDIVNNKFNFWFCYAECIHNCTNDKDITPFYESLESLTYFSLKGKTISEVKSWDGDNKGYVIKDGTKTNIFKLEPSVEFPGY
jgi:hypothetical protein